jgi:hypothetical protein
MGSFPAKYEDLDYSFTEINVAINVALMIKYLINKFY